MNNDDGCQCLGGGGEAVCSERLPQKVSQRVHRRKTIVLLAKGGVAINAIAAFVQCSVATVRRWINRMRQTGDLKDRPRSGRPLIYSEAMRLRLVAFYCQVRPLPDCGRWTVRWAALHLKQHPERIDSTPSKSTLHRILKANKLKPHQSPYFLHISDPEFFPKMEHLIDLFKNPPPNLFFFDESPGIQVLKRLFPDQQTEATKRRLEEFEYIRNGTMDIFAFLNHTDGRIYAECHAEHATATFLEVFTRHISRLPNTQPVHYVMDNLSTHCGYPFCQVVAACSGVECPPHRELDNSVKRRLWLQSGDKRVVIHFTPFHGSWLNLVEIWFGIMGRKVLCESFGSAERLKRAFYAFVAEWNDVLAHPFRWSYDGKGLHQKAVKRFIHMLHTSATQIEMRLLTKQMQVMSNLLSNYFTEVDNEVWHELADVLRARFDLLSHIIQREPGPQRKKKAEAALAELYRALYNRTNIERKRAA
ncbi:MAG: IS630 family transposase [Anaerolineales bacterium]